MSEQWLNLANWGYQQWLIVTILAFIVIAIGLLIYRLFTITRSLNRKRELPNLRPGRRINR